MATRLSDVVIPELFEPIMLKMSTYLSMFWQTGAMATNDLLQQFGQQNYGAIVHMPFYDDLDRNESNQSSDNPAETATPDAVNETDQRAIKNQRNRAWSSADLVAALNGRDPMNMVAQRVAQYWADQIDQTAVRMLTGLRLETASAADMVYTAYADVASPTGDNLISAENIIRAKATAGDHSEGFNIICMHSSQYHRLQVLNLIDYIPDSEGRINMPTYLGMRVIVSDQGRVVSGTNSPAYTAYLLKSGSIWYGEGNPKTPVETWRQPNQGNGEGLEELWTRRHWMCHVDGYDWTVARAADGKSPSWTALADGANWSRVVADRKQIPIAFLETN